jgi:histidine triad (HIT) family protein
MGPCIFCQIARHEAPACIVYADELVTGLMALHPQNPGHMLVIPNEHVESMTARPELSAHVFAIGTRLAQVLPCVVSGGSCTYLMHEGFEALHVHLHIIPRHDDDHVELDQRAPEAAREDLERIGARVRAML